MIEEIIAALADKIAEGGSYQIAEMFWKQCAGDRITITHQGKNIECIVTGWDGVTMHLQEVKDDQSQPS